MLSGRTILIVEAQYIVALDIEATLESLGVERVVITQDATHAASITESWSAYDLAIIEVQRESPDQIALAGDLVRQGIPVIGVTTDHDLPQALAWISAAPVVLKPVQADHLIEAIARAIGFNRQNE